MRRLLRIGGLVTLAIVIPAVVATATYAIGVRSLAPATRLEVSVTGGSSDHSPVPARSTPDDHGGSSPGDHGATGSGGSVETGGGGPTPGGATETEDPGGDSKSGSGDGSNSGPGSDGSGSGSGHGGGDD